MKIHLLFNGLGAGNIGDEAMFSGFLNSLNPGSFLSVEVFDRNAPIISTLPAEHSYISHTDKEACLKAACDADVVLLVGDTPIMEEWGLDWPMRYLAGRIEAVSALGKPIHALGVGVDSLHTPEARKLFQEHFLYIKNWTVRSEQCREALIDLGVDGKNVRVGADFAWLFEPEIQDRVWARDQLAGLGVDMNRPILGINIVNEKWAGITRIKKEIAYALDKIASEAGFQVVFFCNETRVGEYFDLAASRQVAGLMKSKCIVLGNTYFTPSQMIALISRLTVAFSQRYHFTVLSILAGTPVLSFARGQKMSSLLKELGEKPIGEMEDIDGQAVYKAFIEALKEKDSIARKQQYARSLLRARSYANLSFLPHAGTGNNTPRLAKISELESRPFKNFMTSINNLARIWRLRQFSNWSKIWEYPWLWFNGLSKIDWPNTTLLDLGSELSPLPWFLASLGARVTLVERDATHVHAWERIRKETALSVDWHILDNERLPFADGSYDVVTSLSVIEHQRDKPTAINEISRVLKRDGLFALSFDICEPNLGMTFPKWNGRALTTAEFEKLIWNHPAFSSKETQVNWNFEDCEDFVAWHRQSAGYHNYTVAAVLLRKIGLASREMGQNRLNTPALIHIPKASNSYWLTRAQDVIEKPIFIHIPKTAGTTLERMLIDQFQGKHVYGIDSENTVESLEQLYSIELSEPDKIRVIAGHCRHGIHQHLPNNYIYFTLLRDPVTRVFSLLDHAYSRSEHHLHRSLRENPVLALTSKRLLAEISDLQTRTISGLFEDGTAQLPPVTRAHLDVAKERLRNYPVFGITEEFDLSIELINRKFGWSLKKVERQNVTKESKFRESAYPDLIEKIKELNALDLELYGFARSLFHERIRSMDQKGSS